MEKKFFSERHVDDRQSRSRVFKIRLAVNLSAVLHLVLRVDPRLTVKCEGEWGGSVILESEASLVIDNREPYAAFVRADRSRGSIPRDEWRGCGRESEEEKK